MNPGEWGRLDSGEIGIYYSKRTGLKGEAEVWSVDPAIRDGYTTGPDAPTMVVGGHVNIDDWLLDAWRELKDPLDLLNLSNDPLLLLVRVPQGNDVTQGQAWLYDPEQKWGSSMAGTLFRVPNFELYIENRDSRALNIVPDFPAIIVVHYQFLPGGTPIDWELRWQEVDDSKGNFSGESFFPFGSREVYSTDKVIGVDIQRLDQPNANFVPQSPENVMYFVYVLRRHDTGGGALKTDHIDFYIFEYDPSGNTSRVVPGLQGTADFPQMLAVDGHTVDYSFIGDTESDVNPEGNPCIVIIANPVEQTPLEPADEQFGIVVLFTFKWASLTGTPGLGDWTLDILTPPIADGAEEAARKDPEPVTVHEAGVGDWVYIYNRQSNNALGKGPPWVLHRTLAWKP